MGLFSINSKMKKSANEQYKKIVNFTLPAWRTKDGFTTCPNAKNCISGCYARMGAYLWPKVYEKHNNNLLATQNNMFIDLAVSELIKIKANLVRIHDSGDFYSEEYFDKWVKIAQKLPNIKFYAYTKMISMVKSKVLPVNLVVIFSYGGTQDELINVNTDRHSKVFSSIEELEANGYIDTSNDDTHALGDNPKIGLVYHGVKKFENTNWNKIA